MCQAIEMHIWSWSGQTRYSSIETLHQNHFGFDAQ